jgi:hypothetical protein
LVVRLGGSILSMCVMCAMTAAAGATGARTWLQNSHATWLTPRRMRVATIGVMSAAVVGSTVGLSGSTAPTHRTTQHSVSAKAAPVATRVR